MNDVCMHDKFELELRLKLVGTAVYFFCVAAYFYMTERSGTVISRSGSIMAPGGITIRGVEIIGALALGTLVFGVLPGKKICKQCGHSWRF
jgi:hypothetical protein